MLRLYRPGDPCHTLQHRGYIELQDGLPQWDVADFAEQWHTDYNDMVVEMLEGHKYTGVEPIGWPGGKREYPAGSEWTGGHGGRPGFLAAQMVTEELQQDGIGIYVSATHPSISEETWMESGSPPHIPHEMYVHNFFIVQVPVSTSPSSRRRFGRKTTGALAARRKR